MIDQAYKENQHTPYAQLPPPVQVSSSFALSFDALGLDSWRVVC